MKGGHTNTEPNNLLLGPWPVRRLSKPWIFAGNWCAGLGRARGQEPNVPPASRRAEDGKLGCERGKGRSAQLQQVGETCYWLASATDWLEKGPSGLLFRALQEDGGRTLKSGLHSPGVMSLLLEKSCPPTVICGKTNTFPFEELPHPFP